MGEKLSQFLNAPTAPALTDGMPAATYAATPDATKNYQWTPAQIAETLQTSSLIRTVLTGNLNLYVNASTGSDSYNGLSATYTGGVNGPWATPQHADNVSSSTLDFAGFTVNGNIAAGAYVGIDSGSKTGGGIMQWIGAGPGVTILQSDVNGGSSLSSLIQTSSSIAIDNMTIQPTLADVNDAPTIGLLGYGNTLYLGNFANFSSNLEINNTHAAGGIQVDGSFLFVLPGTLLISGSAISGAMFGVSNGGNIFDLGTWTDNSTNTYFAAFLDMLNGAYECSGASYTTTGSPTGPRFRLQNNSSVFDDGTPLGLSFFPGSIAGTTDGGSTYDGFVLEAQRSIQSSGDLPVVWTDTTLNIVLSAPLSITIPAASTRAGRPLLLQDPTGSWAANNPTFNRTGSDTFDGLTSIVAKINYGWIQLRPMNDGVNSGYKIQGGIWQ